MDRGLYAQDYAKAPEKGWTALPRIDRDHMHLSVVERRPSCQDGQPVNAEAQSGEHASRLLEGATSYEAPPEAREAEIRARIFRIFKKYSEGGEQSDAV